MQLIVQAYSKFVGPSSGKNNGMNTDRSPGGRFYRYDLAGTCTNDKNQQQKSVELLALSFDTQGTRKNCSTGHAE
uniref:Uncharacterized protein n=1 Tax=Trichogramma kaykai TaxID=54128 RepID=A0ABD2W3V9_9HYME